jgi:hypothetical protein
MKITIQKHVLSTFYDFFITKLTLSLLIKKKENIRL